MKIPVECRCGNIVKYEPEKEKMTQDSYYFLRDSESDGNLTADDSGFVQFFCGQCVSFTELKG